MRNIQPDMNVARQRRKIVALTEQRPEAQSYVDHLVAIFDYQVAIDQPLPASEFIPMFQEEFDVPDQAGAPAP